MTDDNKDALVMIGLSAALALLAGAGGLLLVEVLGGTWHDDPTPAVIVSKAFSPSSMSVGSGFVHTPKGSNFVTTTNYEPEHWTVIVKARGELLPIGTTAARWEKAEPGRVVTLQRSKSPVFGFENGTRIK